MWSKHFCLTMNRNRKTFLSKSRSGVYDKASSLNIGTVELVTIQSFRTASHLLSKAMTEKNHSSRLSVFLYRRNLEKQMK